MQELGLGPGLGCARARVRARAVVCNDWDYGQD